MYTYIENILYNKKYEKQPTCSRIREWLKSYNVLIYQISFFPMLVYWYAKHC